MSGPGEVHDHFYINTKTLDKLMHPANAVYNIFATQKSLVIIKIIQYLY